MSAIERDRIWQKALEQLKAEQEQALRDAQRV